MVEIFRQRQIYKKRQRQCKDNDIETKIKKTQILILTCIQVRLKCLATIAGLYWKTADVTLSQEHPKLLQTRDGLFPIYIFFFDNQSLYIFLSLLYPCTMIPCLCCQMLSALTHINCFFLWEISKFVFPFVLPLPLVLPHPPLSSADKNRKV